MKLFSWIQDGPCGGGVRGKLGDAAQGDGERERRGGGRWDGAVPRALRGRGVRGRGQLRMKMKRNRFRQTGNLESKSYLRNVSIPLC